MNSVQQPPVRSANVVFWFSVALGTSMGAALFAHFGVVASLLGWLAVFSLCHLSLRAAIKYDEGHNPNLKLSEQIAMVGMVIFLPMIIIIGLLEALLTFILFAQFALNLQTHDYRRLYLGIGVSIIGIVTGAVEAKTGAYLVFFLIYATAVSMTLGYAYIDQRSDTEIPDWHRKDRLRAASYLVGAATLIYLLLPRLPAGNLGAQPGSDHFYRDKSWESEAQDISQDGRTASSPAQELMEKLAEQMASEEVTTENEPTDNESSTNSGRQEAEGSKSERPSGGEAFSYRGFDQQFDIRNADDQGDRFSNQIVARMRANRPLYLRARIFDQFDGIRWHSSGQQLTKLNMEFGGITLAPPSEDAVIEAYEIFVEQNLGDYVPAAAVPVEVSFPSTVIGIDAFGQLHSPGTLISGTSYAVESVRFLKHGRSFAETTYIELPGYRQIPDNLDPRIMRLASEITKGSTTQMAAAIALEQHLRSDYQYSFESVFTSQNVTPLSEFLFETRRGHCEYFASALAIMLRTQGIPARLVTGFSATQQNPLTGYFDIYALDGHAWVEAYVDGIGWLELEPTAYYDGPTPETETLSAEQINQYVERQQRMQEVLGREGEISFTALMSGLWQGLYLIVTWLGAYLKLGFFSFWHWLVAMTVGAIVGRMLWLQLRPRWRAYRIRQQLNTALQRSPENHLSEYLNAIDKLLANAGVQRPKGMTIEQFLGKLKELIEVDETSLAAVFNKQSYHNEEVTFELTNYRQLFERLYSIHLKAHRGSAWSLSDSASVQGKDL